MRSATKINPLTEGKPINVYRCVQKRQYACRRKEGMKEQNETVKCKSRLEYNSLSSELCIQFGTQLFESVRNVNRVYVPNISSGSPMGQTISEH